MLSYRLQNKLNDADCNVKLINFALTFIQELLIYLLFGYHIIIKKVFTAGDFLVVFHAMNTFKAGCSGIIDVIIPPIEGYSVYRHSTIKFYRKPTVEKSNVLSFDFPCGEM